MRIAQEQLAGCWVHTFPYKLLQLFPFLEQRKEKDVLRSFVGLIRGAQSIKSLQTSTCNSVH